MFDQHNHCGSLEQRNDEQHSGQGPELFMFGVPFPGHGSWFPCLLNQLGKHEQMTPVKLPTPCYFQTHRMSQKMLGEVAKKTTNTYKHLISKISIINQTSHHQSPKTKQNISSIIWVFPKIVVPQMDGL